MTLLPMNHPQGGGIFGKPRSRFGMFDEDPYELNAPMPQMAAAPAPEKKGGGFFGQGGAGRAIAGSIGDYLLQASGMRPIYGPQMQFRQALAARERLMQQQRQAGLEDYAAKRQYDLANPKPVNNDTVADYDFWKSVLSPEEFQQYVQNNYINPSFYTGADGRRYANPVAAPPTRPVGKLTPIVN